MQLNRTTRHICALLIVGALGLGCSKGDDSEKEPPVAESPTKETDPKEPAKEETAAKEHPPAKEEAKKDEEPEDKDTITFGSAGPEAYSSYEERVTLNMGMSMKLTKGDTVLQHQRARTRTRGVQKGEDGEVGGPKYDADDLPADNRYEEQLRMEREEREAQGR